MAKKRRYETYNFLSGEAQLCYIYAIVALVAIAHNLRDVYPSMSSRSSWITLWSLVGLGTFCVGIHLRKGKLRNILLGNLLLIFSVILMAFALLLSYYHPQLID
jgi:hypothetical protein